MSPVLFSVRQLCSIEWKDTVSNRKLFYTGFTAFTLSVIGLATQVVPTHLKQRDLPVYPALTESCERLADRLVVIVVDGGRKDVWFNPLLAPNFNLMVRSGASGLHETPYISATAPFIKMFASGLQSDALDMFNNFTSVDQRYGSLFESANKRGLTTHIIGPPAWSSYKEIAKVEKTREYNYSEYQEADQFIAERLNNALKETPSDILLVHFFGADEAAHLYGGESSQYKQQIQVIDRQLGLVLESLGPKSALLVVADHGTDKAGYHFGFDPIVNLAPFVFYSKTPVFKYMPNLQIHSKDFAPTVSCILRYSCALSYSRPNSDPYF